MTVQQMRNLVYNAYPGSKWKARVTNMPDDQIIAMYHSLVKQWRIKG